MKQVYLQSKMRIWQKQKWRNEWRNGGTSERMNEKAKKNEWKSSVKVLISTSVAN